jgi:hypothetical protein
MCVFFRPPPVSTHKNIFLLSGDRGVGKSAVLAQWLKEIEEEDPDLFIIHHFIGASPGDNDISLFLRQCTRELRKHFLLHGLLLIFFILFYIFSSASLNKKF